MEEPELIALDSEEPFQFACGPGVACFNQCCQDLNQALMPYDVLQLRLHLKLTWEQFLSRHAALYAGPGSGLPVVSLRFSHSQDKRCPFVTPQGCSVYTARPTSCRLYPVARALQRSRRDGRLSEHFALVKEPHCLGFHQGPRQTARQWIEDQGAAAGLAANDQLMELIALKNRLRPGPLSAEHQQWAVMAFYDLDLLKQEAAAGRLKQIARGILRPLPSPGEEFAWLSWGLQWLRLALFGEAK
ncbi:MAG: YkgJ family cysteine cluster protein [Desulfobacteraceae bacterium]|nr:YkgJ family cysteine cluster protein [Desulfobacteraceae bacterium]